MNSTGSKMNRFYFQHDCGAMDDDRILDLRADHGWCGYGLFWAILELLHRNDGLMVFDVKRIGFALGADQAVVHKILTGYGLFEFTDDNLHFWSARLLSQIKHRSKLMELRQEAGRKGGKARAKQDGSVAEANDKQLLGKSQPKESKGKESKGKESAVAVAIAPALTSIPEMEDVIRSFASAATSRGIDPAQVKIVTHAKNFLDHYGSQGWRKGNGMPITDWRLLVSRWLTTELGKRDPQNSPKPTRTWGQ